MLVAEVSAMRVIDFNIEQGNTVNETPFHRAKSDIFQEVNLHLQVKKNDDRLLDNWKNKI